MRDTVQGTSGNDILYTSETVRRILGLGGDDFISAEIHGGGIYGGAGNDTLIGGGLGYQQTHMYGGPGDDTLYMGVSDKLAPFGDHAWGGQGADRFVFQVAEGDDSARITGRIDDFDPSRDEIWIDDTKVDLLDPPENVRFVQYHNQPWILIDDRILYALEGARQFESINHDHNADHENGVQIDIGNDDQEERHFIDWPEAWKDGVPKSADIIYADFVSYFPAHEIDPAKLGDLRQINGTSGPDSIVGGAKGEMIYGGDKPDTLYGNGGDDVIDGGEWHDVIYGGAGQDSIAGGIDNDLIYGGAGSDVIYGGSGEDTIYGGNGNDRLYGNSGNDLIYGDTGNDTLAGGWGDDTLYGGAGDDVLYAALGPNDPVLTHGGKSKLVGGDGNDSLYAAANGETTIEGGAGHNVIFAAENAMITLRDFDLQTDTFNFNGLSPGAEALNQHLSHRQGPDGSDMVLNLGTNTMVIFNGFDESSRESLLESLRKDPSIADVDPNKQPVHGMDGIAPVEGIHDNHDGHAVQDKEDPQAWNNPSDGSCFVATACYGDSMHPDVAWLRLYRQRVLRKSVAGRCFIGCYNFLGPKLARLVCHQGKSGFVMRTLLGVMVAKGQKIWPNLRW